MALGQHPRQRLLQAAGQALAKNARNVERLCPSRSSSSPHTENRIFPVQGSPRPSPLWENHRAQGMWWALLLPWDGHSVQERRWGVGLAPLGSTQWACEGWMFVEDLLHTLCFIHGLILNLTNPIRFSLPGEETETRRGHGNMPEGTSWQVAEADLVQASLIVEPTCS